MSVLIGHSSIDENGKARGGQSGDQTKKEVCKREWYKASWDVLLRCTDPAMAEKMAIACEQACDNNNIGYDQNQRNTLNTQAKKVKYDLSKITTKCECDCSSLMCVCAIAAGIPESALYQGNNMRTTRNMRAAFKATGKFEVLTDSKYLSSDEFLQRGDILVNEGCHTLMVLSNGTRKISGKFNSSNLIPNSQSNGSKVIGIATSKGRVNVRSGPSTSFKIIGGTTKGMKVEVLEITSNNWYKIIWKEGIGYVSNVSSAYFTYNKLSNSTSSIEEISRISYKVKINTHSLYIRRGVGTKYPARGSVRKDQIHTIIEEVKYSDGSKWGLLEQYKANRDGWINLSYTEKI